MYLLDTNVVDPVTGREFARRIRSNGGLIVCIAKRATGD